MSKEIKSASARVKANCGAEAKAQAGVTTLPTSQELIDGITGRIDGAVAFIDAWLNFKDRLPDLRARPVGSCFCDGLRDLLAPANHDFAALGERDALSNRGVEAWNILGGTLEVLTVAAIANEFRPFGGVAVRRLLDEVRTLLLPIDEGAAPTAAERLQ